MKKFQIELTGQQLDDVKSALTFFIGYGPKKGAEKTKKAMSTLLNKLWEVGNDKLKKSQRKAVTKNQ